MQTDIEAPFVVSHNFCAIRANSVDELLSRLREFNATDGIEEEIATFRLSVSNNGHAAAVAAVKETLGGEVINQSAPAAASEVTEPEVVTGKYGEKFTYHLVDAPDLPDGRGKYVFKEWTDKNGKARRAFIDPIEGPKPAKPPAQKAPIIWK
jgi:hypothetical protein